MKLQVDSCSVADPVAGWGERGKKHKIYAAAFDSHLFYD